MCPPLTRSHIRSWNSAVFDTQETFQPPSSLFDLTGKVIVVTGATSGIGARICGAIHAAGASVIAAGRRVDRLEKLAVKHSRLTPIVCDVESDNECHKLINSTISLHGQIDGLVNNAGKAKPLKAEGEDPDEFRHILEVNLVAPFALSHYAAQFMLRQPNGGVILNIASILGIVGLGRIPQASYTASKAGLINLTRELAAQWARRGIRVNAIAPGWFPTEMTDELFGTDEGRSWVNRLTPMARAGRVAELDGAAVFLLAEASSYITGCVIAVDGGWTAV